MGRNLFVDIDPPGRPTATGMPGSMAHLGERLIHLDPGATERLERDVYVTRIGADGTPRSVLEWKAGEYVRPEVLERINTKTARQLLPSAADFYAEAEEEPSDVPEPGEQVGRADEREQG